jgi:hypothetical protein
VSDGEENVKVLKFSPDTTPFLALMALRARFRPTPEEVADYLGRSIGAEPTRGDLDVDDE